MLTAPARLARPLAALCLLLVLAEARPLFDFFEKEWDAKRTDAIAPADAGVADAPTSGEGVEMYFENEEEFSTVKVATNARPLVLECVVVSSGASATIHWLHNGQRVIQGSADLSVVNDAAAFEEAGPGASGGPDVKTVSRLRVDCMDRRKIGKYTCVADTPRQRRTVSRQVVLADGGSEGRCSDGESTQTRIYMYKKSHDDSGGRTVQLFCRATGSPQPRIQWYYAGGPRRVRLESGSKFEVLGNGDLLIKDLDADDFGDYVCEASNGASRSSISTNVYVYA